MNLTTSIIGISIFLLIIFAMILMNKGDKTGQKQILQKLFKYAEINECKISESNCWNNKAIGIDKNSHKLFFVKNEFKEIKENHLNLNEFQKCSISTVNKTIKNKDEVYKRIEKLNLMFTYKDPKKTQLNLEFYNSATDNLSINGELQLSEKWLKIVNNEIMQLV